VEIHGEMVDPEADPGFRFNPGELFGGPTILRR